VNDIWYGANSQLHQFPQRVLYKEEHSPHSVFASY